MRLSVIALVIPLLLTLHGCASTPKKDREYQLNYARITKVNRVPRPSAVPAGMVVGGLTGLFLTRNSASPNKRTAATLGGVALGAVLADSMDDGRVFEYHLLYRDGRVTRFVTEKSHFQQNDCVVVERGQHANLRRVADALCNSVEPAVASVNLQTDADQCHEAKEQLLAAETDEQVTQASRKVRVLCQYTR